MASRRRSHGGLPGSHPAARPLPAGAGDAGAGLPLETAVVAAGPFAGGEAPAEISTAPDSSATFKARWPDASSRILCAGGSLGRAAGEAGATGGTGARVGLGIGLVARTTWGSAGPASGGGDSSITRITTGAASGEADAVLGGRTHRRTSARQRWARSESAKPSRRPMRFSLVLVSRVVLPSVTRKYITVLPAFERVAPAGFRRP